MSDAAVSVAPSWRELLTPYSRPHLGRAVRDLLTSVVAYALLSVAGYVLVDVSAWLAVALAPLAAAFLLRTYMVFHDCAHGSFLPGKDRKSTRLNSSHANISYAVFCLKKKN